MANTSNASASHATTAAFDDLMQRLRAIRSSTSNAPRQVAIGRALTLLINDLSAAMGEEAQAISAFSVAPAMSFDEAQFAIWEASQALSALAQLSNDASEARSVGASIKSEELCCLLSVVNSHLQRGLSAIEQIGTGASA